MESQHQSVQVSDEVSNGLRNKLPVVALESTVITNGLPYPENIELALAMENMVRGTSAIPATIALMNGVVKVGLSSSELEFLATSADIHKISTREISSAIALGWTGGTTVAGTIYLANMVDIKVFATGGIGGVHRSINGTSSIDISADLRQLSKTPIIVVCAGAKAILDLPATLEYLETNSVPVVGYGTDIFPAFYSRDSGLKNPIVASSVFEIARIAKVHWSLGLKSSILVTNPLNESDAVDVLLVENAIETALREVNALGVHGQSVTPYLLKRVSEITHGKSLESNIKLLLNNAQLAGEVSNALL
jgi:pseudouridine-5'-phosphate glycosidase